jgi:hypothetical protein
MKEMKICDLINLNLFSIVVVGGFLCGSIVFAVDQQPSCVVVNDVFEPLPSGAIQLHGQYGDFIKNSVEHWNKGVVPYQKLVQLFRDGEPMFAMGCMWGLSIRCSIVILKMPN